jgi:hypothetical protein
MKAFNKIKFLRNYYNIAVFYSTWYVKLECIKNFLSIKPHPMINLKLNQRNLNCFTDKCNAQDKHFNRFQRS